MMHERRTRRVGLSLVAMLVGASAVPRLNSAEERSEKATQRMWTFDTDRAGEAPAGFSCGRTGTGRGGRWVVQVDQEAPSAPNVLAQVDADATDYRFPVAVANEPTAKDFHLTVRCKPVSGQIDQACGLVFRYQNEKNYYVTRANALEGNIRLYHVVNGDRRQFAGWKGAVTSGVWHELRVDAQADHLEVYWDGRKTIDAHDNTFPHAGKVGVWTKADSLTYFDDLRVEPLDSSVTFDLDHQGARP